MFLKLNIGLHAKIYRADYYVCSKSRNTQKILHKIIHINIVFNSYLVEKYNKIKKNNLYPVWIALCFYNKSLSYKNHSEIVYPIAYAN